MSWPYFWEGVLGIVFLSVVPASPGAAGISQRYVLFGNRAAFKSHSAPICLVKMLGKKQVGLCANDFVFSLDISL